MNTIEAFLASQLTNLQSKHLLRALKPDSDLVDFSSNDYLGLAHCAELKQLIDEELNKYPDYLIGSTGSRLISGNTNYATELEQWLSAQHNAQAGLLFNSGYDANLGVFSSIPQKGDTIILDEKVHACIIDGARLSYATRYKFMHNDLGSLEQKLKVARGNIFIGIESIYSMDGDSPDLKAMVELAAKYNANIIIDEAHGAGVLGYCGKGLVSELGLESKVFVRIHTFGKAIGSHGAIVLGSTNLRDFLINTARSFIFTTAAPFHSLVAVKMAYHYLNVHPELQKLLRDKIDLFKSKLSSRIQLLESSAPIQSIIVEGNETVVAAAESLKKNGFSVGAVRSPTVEKGKERLRICLHLFNSDEDVARLANEINQNL
ncbi:aminotransferase class I/II-fold pyridoxal phosphate-dependent enzyme [Solitalea lacus]|uniref:aminotransferase class I/II-fold pyridoxal phosphate-dependent enzyme n=1 Tax=Solitalea lacus TaxID=2911172 RepID=UPI001ED9DABE|nr:8-amino-7-oxononanoate synthase [Solitalea lacus]UKJ06277.1 8-amino-7-oxononanoate synthase [Solitalea lacus]